jgi:hypothetical protein
MIKKGLIRFLFLEYDKVAVHKVDGLNNTLNIPPLPEQIDKPKALALGFYSSDIFHDLVLLIPRIHIHGAQAHVILLIIFFQSFAKMRFAFFHSNHVIQKQYYSLKHVCHQRHMNFIPPFGVPPIFSIFCTRLYRNLFSCPQGLLEINPI